MIVLYLSILLLSAAFLRNRYRNILLDREYRRILLEHQERLKNNPFIVPEECDELEAAKAAFGICGVLTKSDIQNRFRHLSKIHHPDKNGDPESFKTLIIQRDILLGK